MENVIGLRFGKWEIVEFVGRNKKSEQIYKCLCECGTLKEQRLSTLKGGASVQCKSCFMSELNKIEDLIGKQYGSWQVLEKKKNIDRNEWYYLCRCECGTVKEISGSHLRSKQTTKCHICRNKTHGMSQTDTFRIWTGILRRCLNPNFKAYKYYGGRGIKICERWLEFKNFFEDMGHRPSNLQIDRINNDGNYEPNNCRWVTAKVNNANRKIIKKKKEI